MKYVIAQFIALLLTPFEQTFIGNLVGFFIEFWPIFGRFINGALTLFMTWHQNNYVLGKEDRLTYDYCSFVKYYIEFRVNS